MIMIKIDLHLHTVATISDANFVFSMEKLKDYVESYEIDCIAITNHNLFDFDQYNEIVKELDIVVLPGIEINLENGHCLLISDRIAIADFRDKCNVVTKKIQDPKDQITIKELYDIFDDLSNYILIPHYDKEPKLSKAIIKNLEQYILAGEVQNAKKFVKQIKSEDSVTPVLFSDIRIHDETQLCSRQTYLKTDEISLRSIKSCLHDKNKVFLSQKENHNYFEATKDGLTIASGLNILLGGRSSGKTVTLNKIMDSQKNVLYIRQFELIEKSEEDDEKKFNKLISAKKSNVADDYLKNFKEVVIDVVNIDQVKNEYEIDQYLSSLKKIAAEEEKKDAFSKAAMFNESEFINIESSPLEKLISSVELLIEERQYSDTLHKHINQEDLINLRKDLILLLINNKVRYKKIRVVNELVKNIKAELRSHTAFTQLEDANFYNLLIEKAKMNKFVRIVYYLKQSNIIEESQIGKFKIIAKTKTFTGAKELKDKCGKQGAFSPAFQVYDNPIKYLQALKDISVLDEADYYKYFVNVEYDIINNVGASVSGGERSEFNLLQKLKNAYQYDMLLIDEPESSFDNIFLDVEANALIKEISQSIPVIVATHNNTVGASIKPDYIIHTRREIIEGEANYEVFTGAVSDLKLKNKDNKEISNYRMQLDCLEAGYNAYNERLKAYEILKD